MLPPVLAAVPGCRREPTGGQARSAIALRVLSRRDTVPSITASGRVKMRFSCSRRTFPDGYGRPQYRAGQLHSLAVGDTSPTGTGLGCSHPPFAPLGQFRRVSSAWSSPAIPEPVGGAALWRRDELRVSILARRLGRAQPPNRPNPCLPATSFNPRPAVRPGATWQCQTLARSVTSFQSSPGG